MRLTRPEFEEMVRPRIRETIEALGRAARSAGLGFDGHRSRAARRRQLADPARGRDGPRGDRQARRGGCAPQAHDGARRRVRRGPGAPRPAGAGGGRGGGCGRRPGDGRRGGRVRPPARSPGPRRRRGLRRRPRRAGAGAGGRRRRRRHGAARRPGASPRRRGSARSRPASVSVPMAAGLGAIALVAVIAVGASGCWAARAGRHHRRHRRRRSVAVLASPSPARRRRRRRRRRRHRRRRPSRRRRPPRCRPPRRRPQAAWPGSQGITINGQRVRRRLLGLPLHARHARRATSTSSGTRSRRRRPASRPTTNWILYDGPNPFKGYKVADRPDGRHEDVHPRRRADHTVIQKTGNCVDLPG